MHVIARSLLLVPARSAKLFHVADSRARSLARPAKVYCKHGNAHAMKNGRHRVSTITIAYRDRYFIPIRDTAGEQASKQASERAERGRTHAPANTTLLLAGISRTMHPHIMKRIYLRVCITLTFALRSGPRYPRFIAFESLRALAANSRANLGGRA